VFGGGAVAPATVKLTVDASIHDTFRNPGVRVLLPVLDPERLRSEVHVHTRLGERRGRAHSWRANTALATLRASLVRFIALSAPRVNGRMNAASVTMTSMKRHQLDERVSGRGAAQRVRNESVWSAVSM
jgi:hypothetical protein